MEKQKRIILCLSSLILVAVWSLAFTPSATAFEWKLGKGEGRCLQGKKVLKPKYCHNCEEAGGDRIKWTFDVTCDGKPSRREINATLDCGGNKLNEGAQLRALQAKASKHLPSATKKCK